MGLNLGVNGAGEEEWSLGVRSAGFRLHWAPRAKWAGGVQGMEAAGWGAG